MYLIDSSAQNIDTLSTNTKGYLTINVKDYKDKHLMFLNNFDQFIYLEINAIAATGSYKICLDSLKYSHSPFVDKITSSDTLIIKYNSRGCFHFDSYLIRLIKRNDEIIFSVLKKGREMKSKSLSNHEISIFWQFETELVNHFLTFGGCTTVDDYELQFKSVGRIYSDSSCEWHGLRNLLDKYGLN